MTMRYGSFRLAGCMVALLSCSRPAAPARIEVAQSSLVVLDDRPFPVTAHLVDAQGNVLLEPALTYSATPVAVAEVSQGGRVTCRSTGDASLVIAGGGQSASATIRCRPVGRLRVPASETLTMGRDPAPVGVTAVDAAGAVLSDVTLSVRTADPSIASVVDGKLVARSLGRTTVSISAGRVTESFPVVVRELIESKPLALADGSFETWALQSGEYQLELTVKDVNGGSTGAQVSWVGAACKDATESQHYEGACAVENTASLTVRNPTVLGLGPALSGFLNLYKTAR